MPHQLAHLGGLAAKCRKNNPDGSQFCNGCGTVMGTQKTQPDQTSALQPTTNWWNNLGSNTKLAIGLSIAVIILLGIMNSTINNSRSRRETVTPANQNAVASQPKATEPPTTEPSIPPSVHLANAKKALADGYVPSGKNKAWGRVKDAKESLQLIRFTDKEYSEARKLMQEVERREIEIAEWSTTVARKLFAEQLERNYLEKGMDVTVSLSGPNNTIIKLKYILISRPLVYQLTNDAEFMATLRNAGFKKVIFTDGYKSTWTQDLN